MSKLLAFNKPAQTAPSLPPNWTCCKCFLPPLCFHTLSSLCLHLPQLPKLLPMLQNPAQAVPFLRNLSSLLPLKDPLRQHRCPCQMLSVEFLGFPVGSEPLRGRLLVLLISLTTMHSTVLVYNNHWNKLRRLQCSVTSLL